MTDQVAIAIFDHSGLLHALSPQAPLHHCCSEEPSLRLMQGILVSTWSSAICLLHVDLTLLSSNLVLQVL